jgi:DNA primase
MAKGIQYADFVTLDDIRALDIRQVLNVLGIEVDARTNKCICPIHDDTDPSMQVNEDYVYCHACGTGWDSIGLVQAYLRQRQNSHATLGQVKRWFIQQWDRFTAQPTPAHYKKHEYKGPVPREWVEYWHSMMSTERRQQLYKERLLTDDTIDLFRIGWRPDWQAWAIPFWLTCYE